MPPLVEAMVALDAAFEKLELARRAGWKTPPGHPDVDPAHEALRAREILTELMRTDDFKARPRDVQAMMEHARSAAAELERHLCCAGPAPTATSPIATRRRSKGVVRYFPCFSASLTHFSGSCSNSTLQVLAQK